MMNPFETIAERLERIEEAINEIKETGAREPESQEPKDRFLTKKEAAKLLGLGTSSIDNYRRAGELTPYRFGKSVRFKLSDIEEMAERKRQNI